jgi:hypothetical protein
MRREAENSMRKIAGLGARSVVSLLGVGSLVGLTASCSSPSPAHEYAVPSNVCGTHVARTLLEPLLPAGEQIGTRPTSTVGVKRCRLVVDGKVIFSSSLEKRDANTTADDVASSAHGVDPTDSRAEEGHVIYSTTGAVGLVRCPDSASALSTVWATVRTSHAVKAAAMRAFIEGYVSAAAKSDACRTLSGP